MQLKRRNGEKIAKNDAKLVECREEKVQIKMKSEKPQEAANIGLERGWKKLQKPTGDLVCNKNIGGG